MTREKPVLGELAIPAGPVAADGQTLGRRVGGPDGHQTPPTHPAYPYRFGHWRTSCPGS